LTGSAPSLTYTPNAGITGTDSFQFRVNDGQLNSAAATVSITITPPNTAPVATAQSVSVQSGQSLVITLSGTDADGDALTFSVVSGPAHGSLGGTAPTLVYTPAGGFTGTDSFQFIANDGRDPSTAATVAINVLAAPMVTVTASAPAGGGGGAMDLAGLLALALASFRCTRLWRAPGWGELGGSGRRLLWRAPGPIRLM
jgi:hypothetical protein